MISGIELNNKETNDFKLNILRTFSARGLVYGLYERKTSFYGGCQVECVSSKNCGKDGNKKKSLKSSKFL